MVQIITVEQMAGIEMSGEYMSPTVTRERMAQVLRQVVADSPGKDVLIGDLNARNHLWDTTTNPNGRELVQGTIENRYNVRAPGSPSYGPMGREGTSNPDLSVKNFSTSSKAVMNEGQ